MAEAQQRLEDQFFDELQPAVGAARKALEGARAAQPQMLIAVALGEAPPESAIVAEAERALADADARVADARHARRLLHDERRRAEAALGLARRVVDEAVTAAVAADPRRAELQEEALCAIRRGLRLMRALRTSGTRIGFVEASGLRAAISDAAGPIATQTFFPDATWLAALDRLREDADAELPGLPPNDTGDGGRAAAA